MTGDHYDRSAHALLLSNDRDDASTIGPASSSASIYSVQNDRSVRHRNLIRYGSFASAIFSCLCGGSLTAYSLYGHIFQERLRYTQSQVNIVIVAAQLAMYLPVSILGYLCDRHGPAPLSFVAAVLFGSGYLLAAFTYKSADVGIMTHQPGWPFSMMVLSFIFIGVATCCIYLSAVTTCAKNFGRGKYRGLALASPIASFGLSGMWQSQVASRVLYERKPNGSIGDVDVFKFFIFLAVLLMAAGLLGSFALQVVDEEELIDNAVEELEQSGLLDTSSFFRNGGERGYGSFADREDDDLRSAQSVEDVIKAREEEEARKKTWLLNGETRRFLADPTMWWLAGGFFLVAGPGDTFINNLGTIIGTLYSPSADSSVAPTTAATHVSIVAITSTIARIFAGTATDLLAPANPVQRFHTSASNSIASLPSMPPNRRLTVSRVTFLLGFTIVMSLGQAILASGFIQNHGERFWIVSGLIGSGYGAVFSLTPIIITIIWGVENFGTNWGIVAMCAALGAPIWGALYSGVYQWYAGRSSSSLNGAVYGGDDSGLDKDILCFGKECYQSTFWVMTVAVWVACGMWLWAWKGRDGWSRRGIAV
jgi:MFS family permease